MTPIVFHDRPNKLWPMSHLKPGLGELLFLNWAYSFVAGKIKNSCRDFLAIRESVGEDLISTILHGQDYELCKINEAHGTIDQIVQFLQHPQMNGDIWKVIEAVEQNFEKRVGLTELIYGLSSKQLRSAQEAQLKSSQIQVRPDDMAQKVEEAMTTVARKEALASRWHLTGQDVAPVLGDVGARWWDQLVWASNPEEILYQLEYRIEAGSARKPNKEGQQDKMTLAMQTLFQPLWGLAMQTGQVQQVNALLEDWAKANDLDPGRYQIQPPPPPPMPGQGGPDQGAAEGGEGPPSQGMS